MKKPNGDTQDDAEIEVQFYELAYRYVNDYNMSLSVAGELAEAAIRVQLLNNLLLDMQQEMESAHG